MEFKSGRVMVGAVLEVVAIIVSVICLEMDNSGRGRGINDVFGVLVLLDDRFEGLRRDMFVESLDKGGCGWSPRASRSSDAVNRPHLWYLQRLSPSCKANRHAVVLFISTA